MSHPHDSQSQRQSRQDFAATLTEFNDQRSWYGARAGQFKKNTQRLDMLIILAGGLIAALPILKPGSEPHWTEIFVSFLGAVIVLCQGAHRVFRYSEIWPEYRLSSERMKREWRLFINASDPYDVSDTDSQSLYVERLEKIIADEQKIFFERANVKATTKRDRDE